MSTLAKPSVGLAAPLFSQMCKENVDVCVRVCSGGVPLAAVSGSGCSSKLFQRFRTSGTWPSTSEPLKMSCPPQCKPCSLWCRRYAISESASEIACNAGWCCTHRPAVTRAFYACLLLWVPGDMVRAAADAVEQAGNVETSASTSSFPCVSASVSAISKRCR